MAIELLLDSLRFVGRTILSWFLLPVGRFFGIVAHKPNLEDVVCFLFCIIHIIELIFFLKITKGKGAKKNRQIEEILRKYPNDLIRFIFIIDCVC
jgi:hypothetical protein